MKRSRDIVLFILATVFISLTCFWGFRYYLKHNGMKTWTTQVSEFLGDNATLDFRNALAFYYTPPPEGNSVPHSPGSNNEPTPSPEYITINQDGTLQRGTHKIGHVRLENSLRERVKMEGAHIPVIFTTDRTTSFSKVKKTMITAVHAGCDCDNFLFQVSGSPKLESCTCDGHEGKSLKMIKLIVEVKNDELYMDNKKIKIDEFKEMIKGKPAGAHGYIVQLSCSDNSSFGTVYEVVEKCNRSASAFAEISLYNDM